MSRGIDCNNPFDLEVATDYRWIGEIRPTNDPDGVLCTFDTIEHGLRAGFLDLHNQQVLHGLSTIDTIIQKYAPPSENDTEAYKAAMVKATGTPGNEPVNLSDPSTLALWGKAVIMQEQGLFPYTDDQITQAVNQVLS